MTSQEHIIHMPQIEAECEEKLFSGSNDLIIHSHTMSIVNSLGVQSKSEPLNLNFSLVHFSSTFRGPAFTHYHLHG